MSHINYISSKRRTVRRFVDAKVDPEELQDILETALKAPTSRNKRATYFVVIDDKEKLKSLSRCKPMGATAIAEGSLAIAVCANTKECVRPDIDCAIAASYIQLAVTDVELASCWVHVHDSGNAESYVKGALGIPQEDYVLCIIAIGVPKESDLEPRIEELQWERVYIDKYEERHVSTDKK